MSFFCLQEMAKILNHPRVYGFLHVPVQSASDNVLADMKREYCADDFRHVVDFLKDKLVVNPIEHWRSVSFIIVIIIYASPKSHTSLHIGYFINCANSSKYTFLVVDMFSVQINRLFGQFHVQYNLWVV